MHIAVRTLERFSTVKLYNYIYMHIYTFALRLILLTSMWMILSGSSHGIAVYREMSLLGT